MIVNKRMKQIIKISYMKNFLLALVFIFAGESFLQCQTSDQLISKCISIAGSDSKYLKDFRVQLGQADKPGDFRYKANISLWKDTKYRFTMCSADDSKGQLILIVKDEANKMVLSSYDKNSGKTYNSVEFICSKSGIYQLGYDFTNDQQGSGIGVISLIK